MTPYQKYLKTLSDKDIEYLWLRHCAPSEAEIHPSSASLSQASDIDWEYWDRNAAKQGYIQADGFYPGPDI